MDKQKITLEAPIEQGESAWREVGQEEFYRVIGAQNVHPQPVEPWPYTSLFRTPYGKVQGKAVDFIPEDSGLTETKYFLPEAAQ